MISYCILEKTCHNFDSEGTYRSPFKFDFEQLKDILTGNWRNSLIFDDGITEVISFQ